MDHLELQVNLTCMSLETNPTQKRPRSELNPQLSCLFVQPLMLDLDLYCHLTLDSAQIWRIVSLDLVVLAYFARLRHQQAAVEGVVLFRWLSKTRNTSSNNTSSHNSSKLPSTILCASDYHYDLHCTILYYTVLHHTTPYHIIPFGIVISCAAGEPCSCLIYWLPLAFHFTPYGVGLACSNAEL